MGRPSLKDKRSAEILDAFAHCVAQYGIEGSTLERIAEQAGVKRTILRHYIGNRDELIGALSARIGQDFLQHTEALFQILPLSGRLEALINLLFDPSTHTSSEDVAVAQALIAASDRYPETATALRTWIVRFDELLSAELRAAFPEASDEAVAAVSFGLLGNYFNVDALRPLQLPQRFDQAAQEAARRLIGTLKA